MTKHTINELFRKSYSKFEQRVQLPDYIRDAAHSLMACRTALLGGHVQSCPDGHYHRIWYNSCKHRICPQCAYLRIQEWLERQKVRILNCDHYHVIFTLPSELRFLWKLNYKLMAAIMFICSRDTVFELLKDPKRIGAKPGIIASLHTWQKTLMFHPHIHCLITGGGLSHSGKWLSVKNSYIFPFAVARDLFRGKVNAAIKKALNKNQLYLPDNITHQQCINLLNKLGRKKWNVKVCEKYSHGKGVLTYLARYLRGGPIANSRIKNITDTHIEFNIGRKKKEFLTLSHQEFIGRYLRHIPPSYSVLVRSYGVYSHGKKEELNKCRHLLGQGNVQLPNKLEWQELFKSSEKSPDRCPECKKKLVTSERINPVKKEVYFRKHAPPAVSLSG